MNRDPNSNSDAPSWASRVPQPVAAGTMSLHATQHTLAQMDDVIRSLKPKRLPQKITSSERKSLLLHQLDILLSMAPDMPYTPNSEAVLKDARSLRERSAGCQAQIADMEQQQSYYRYRQAHAQSGKGDLEMVRLQSGRLVEKICTATGGIADRVNNSEGMAAPNVTPLTLGTALYSEGKASPMNAFPVTGNRIGKEYQRLLVEKLAADLHPIKMTCMGVHPKSDLHAHFQGMARAAIGAYLEAGGNMKFRYNEPDEASKQILRQLKYQFEHPNYQAVCQLSDAVAAILNPADKADENRPPTAFPHNVMGAYRLDRKTIREQQLQGKQFPGGNPLKAHSPTIDQIYALRWAHAVRELLPQLHLERDIIADPSYKSDRESAVVKKIMSDACAPVLGVQRQ
jgi:hypothetical protein